MTRNCLILIIIVEVHFCRVLSLSFINTVINHDSAGFGKLPCFKTLSGGYPSANSKALSIFIDAGSESE